MASKLYSQAKRERRLPVIKYTDEGNSVPSQCKQRKDQTERKAPALLGGCLEEEINSGMICRDGTIPVTKENRC